MAEGVGFETTGQLPVHGISSAAPSAPPPPPPSGRRDGSRRITQNRKFAIPRIWRRGEDLNPRGTCAPIRFRVGRLQPGSATPPRNLFDMLHAYWRSARVPDGKPAPTGMPSYSIEASAVHPFRQERGRPPEPTQDRLRSKKSRSSAALSSPLTGPATATEWFSRGSSRSRYKLRAAPLFGSAAPYTTRASRAWMAAPQHIAHGSTVTYSTAPVNR